MKKLGLLFLMIVSCSRLFGATLYVDLNSTAPAAPFNSWASASTTIQAAVNAAATGDTILVTNGHYLLDAEILVAKQVTIQSINGPETTIVDGQGSVRCFNLGDSACTLSGLTITNGYAGAGGGVFCEAVSGIVTNCILVGNSADYLGGGISGGTVNRCTISGNQTDGEGGGAAGSKLNNSVISNNTASQGGGIGRHYTQPIGIAKNCVINGNTASGAGGGASGCELYNCTVTGNSSNSGRGLLSGEAYNCIIWDNISVVEPTETGYAPTIYQFTCSPDVTHGVNGNMTNAPLLISASRLAANSPCIGAGSAEYASGTDIDGEAWQNPPSMGCDEFWVSDATPTVKILGSALHFAEGYPAEFAAEINGTSLMYVWDFGDGTVVTNEVYPNHGWSQAGTYEVTLTTYSDDYPAGISATQTVEVVEQDATAVYVSPDGNDEQDGLSWATAKATIQAGIDAQGVVGGVVWVSNGTFAVTNQIVMDHAVLLQSLNGPEWTVVDGQGETRCFNIDNSSSVISGFTVTNGSASAELYGEDAKGGGIYGLGQKGVVTNCVVNGNSAGGSGGGMSGVMAYNCIINNNTASSAGGGLAYSVAENCTITGNALIGEDNSPTEGGGGMYIGRADNCIITGNTAEFGGGMYEVDARNCVISENAADYGGGLCFGEAHNCIISGNTASGSGGGLSVVEADHCTISGNTAVNYGGGLYGGGAENCIISLNSAMNGGGVAGVVNYLGEGPPYYRIQVNNCVIAENSASSGGGIYEVNAQNCTISGNTAGLFGGGAERSSVTNCIIWDNEAGEGADLSGSDAYYSCSPDLQHGVDGNITNAPMLISPIHLSVDSPCIGAGSAEYATGTDIDGEAWLNPPSMGCDEFVGNALPPTVQFHCSTLTVATGYPVQLVSDITGTATRFVWNFDDGSSTTNRVFSERVWNQAGTYAVVLTAFSESAPGGVSATQHIEVVAQDAVAVYVAPSGDDVNDGLSWATAKATLQSGIDAQNIIGGSVWVSNGTYAVTNEVVVTKPVWVRGVGAPEEVVVDGQGVARCFTLNSIACIVEGLTVTNGYAYNYGGGIRCFGSLPTVTNCIIVGNSVSRYGPGGGVYQGTLYDCVIRGNSAGEREGGGGMYYSAAFGCTIIENTAQYGGGALDCFLDNCTVAQNTAYYGGGMSSGTADNCWIQGNTATNNGGGLYAGTANNCVIADNNAGQNGGGIYGWFHTYNLYNKGVANNCTITGNAAGSSGGGVCGSKIVNSIAWYNSATQTGNDLSGGFILTSCSPDLTHGVDGNITNAPAFVDAANGDYHLLSNSPCINWGYNAAVVGTMDFDGLPRIAGGYVDMGAYEFQGPFTADMDQDEFPDAWERAHFIGNPMPSGNADLDGLSNWDEYIAGTDPSDAASCLAITNCCQSDGFTVEWGPSVTGRLYRVVWSESLTNSTPIVLQDNIPYPQSSYTDREHNDATTGFYRVEVRMEE
ncbi:MAG: right-handed parallel beta-helix repeat-containing protein [Pontiellaceae bacterium]|nr:right-handed parallel beta-helix repeat-containing protein [Pontiellaceae bacterium]